MGLCSYAGQGDEEVKDDERTEPPLERLLRHVSPVCQREAETEGSLQIQFDFWNQLISFLPLELEASNMKNIN